MALGSRTPRTDRPPLHLTRRPRAGQSVVEFAVVLPLMLLLVVGVADLGRLYVSAVAVEAAAREAADFGSFHATAWRVDSLAVPPVDNRSVTLALMEQRACTAAAGSHLEGYAEPPGTVDHATCTNPSFSYSLKPDDPSCSIPETEPPCVVRVELAYDFRMLVGFPPLTNTIHLTRSSQFTMQDLTPP